MICRDMLPRLVDLNSGAWRRPSTLRRLNAVEKPQDQKTDLALPVLGHGAPCPYCGVRWLCQRLSAPKQASATTKRKQSFRTPKAAPASCLRPAAETAAPVAAASPPPSFQRR